MNHTETCPWNFWNILKPWLSTQNWIEMFYGVPRSNKNSNLLVRFLCSRLILCACVRYLLKMKMAAYWTFAALVSMANAEVFVFETEYSTADCSTGTVYKEAITGLICMNLGTYYAMYSCSGSDATLNHYSDATCSGTPTESHAMSAACKTEGDGVTGKTFTCVEREAVATNNYYSAAGCAESDKLSTSMSLPGGCKATGTATSATSEKYEASGDQLTYTTYSSNDCTGTAVLTTPIPCGGGTCTAAGSMWFKTVMTCSSSTSGGSMVRVELPLLMCFLIRLLIWGPYPKVHLRHCTVERSKLTSHDSGTAALRMAV